MNEIETFYGLVENTLDALRIFQMCRDGRLNRVRRRLHERERRQIRSGSVFVFDEEESGIKRWTDGRLWSPSRILGNFLIYRELEKKGHRTSNNNNNKNNFNSKRSHSQFTDQSSSSLMEISMKLPNQNIKVPRILPKAAAESLDVLWGIPRSEQEREHQDFEVQSQVQAQEYHNRRNHQAHQAHQLHQTQNSKEFQDWLIQNSQQQQQFSINPQDLITERIHRKTQNQSPQTPELSPSNSTSTSSNPMSGESLRVLKSKKLTNNHKGRYIFKSDGFIKKTISIQLEGHTHHLVAYYSLEDFCRGHLQLNEALQGNDDLEIITEESTATATEVNLNLNEIKEQEHSITDMKELPFDPQLMEILRQVPIPVDLMLQQNFRKPAALLASATSTAQGFLAANPGNGEKLITALEYGAINPSDLQQGQIQINSQNLIRKPTENTSNGGFVRNGGIIFSSSSSESFNYKNKTTNTTNTANNSKLFNPRPRRHSSFHPNNVEIGIEATLNNLLDESSQLSGEALEFLSHFSDETPENLDYSFDPSGNMTGTGENINFSNISGILIDNNNQLVVDLENDLNNQSNETSDIGAELFGSILSSNDEGSYNNHDVNNNNSCVIRGEDVMLSDAPKD